jgi:hypothetical protein
MTQRRAIGPTRRQREIERMVDYMHRTDFDDHVRMRAARRAVFKAGYAEIQRGVRCLGTATRRAADRGGAWYYGDAGRAAVRVAVAAAEFAERCQSMVDADMAADEYMPDEVVRLLRQRDANRRASTARTDHRAISAPPDDDDPEPWPDAAA